MSQVLCHTTGSEGVDVELEIEGSAPVEVYVWDSTPGLPPSGAALAAARGEENVTFQEGDRTFVYTKQMLRAANAR
jgi:hypothetical protein